MLRANGSSGCSGGRQSLAKTLWRGAITITRLVSNEILRGSFAAMFELPYMNGWTALYSGNVRSRPKRHLLRLV